MNTKQPETPRHQNAGQRPDGEAMADRTLPPEAHSSEQDDEPSQAQSLTDEAMGRAGSAAGNDSERVAGPEDETGSMPDLVDHMKQMVSSGKIDMSAFRGERSDDDEEGSYGEAANEDDTPRGAE